MADESPENLTPEQKRTRAYSAAQRRLRDAHRGDFNTFLGEELGKFGIEWQPPKTEEQKAQETITNLLAAFPSLRNVLL